MGLEINQDKSKVMRISKHINDVNCQMQTLKGSLQFERAEQFALLRVVNNKSAGIVNRIIKSKFDN